MKHGTEESHYRTRKIDDFCRAPLSGLLPGSAASHFDCPDKINAGPFGPLWRTFRPAISAFDRLSIARLTMNSTIRKKEEIDHEQFRNDRIEGQRYFRISK
jgi:hypothetical protein